MIRDYQIVSPSLEGVLNDAGLVYDGLKRPQELLRVLDRPAASGSESGEESSDSDRESQKVIEGYFHDLYGIFMKRLSHFTVESDPSDEDTVKLQAMLQEMIKVKGLLGRKLKK